MVQRTQIRVRWFDIDRENVVYFGNYFRFFTVAEEEFRRSIGLSDDALKEKYGVGLARVEASCRYRKPARLGDLLKVETKVKLESDTILSFFFRVFRKGEEALLAEGQIRTACVALGDLWKVVRIPQELEARLNRESNECVE